VTEDIMRDNEFANQITKRSDKKFESTIKHERANYIQPNEEETY
jgi:hypothetical protein